jgi:hypothetical protein
LAFQFDTHKIEGKLPGKQSRYIIGLVLFVVLLVGMNTAMTFAVVELSKDTTTDSSGIMKVAGTDTVVETANNLAASKLHSGLPNAAFQEIFSGQVRYRGVHAG